MRRTTDWLWGDATEFQSCSQRVQATVQVSLRCREADRYKSTHSPQPRAIFNIQIKFFNTTISTVLYFLTDFPWPSTPLRGVED